MINIDGELVNIFTSKQHHQWSFGFLSFSSKFYRSRKNWYLFSFWNSLRILLIEKKYVSHSKNEFWCHIRWNRKWNVSSSIPCWKYFKDIEKSPYIILHIYFFVIYFGRWIIFELNQFEFKKKNVNFGTEDNCCG